MLTWVQDHLHNTFFQNTYLLMLMRVCSTLLSYLFWVLAARSLAVDQVGIATGSVTSAMLLAGFAHLGLGYGLVRRLAHSDNPNALLNFSLVTAGLMGLALAGVFLLGLPVWSPRLQPLVSSISTMVLFILLVLSFTLSRIVFYVFLAARRMVFGLYKQTVQSGLGVILLLALHPLLPGYVAAITAYTLALLISLLLAFSFFPQVQPGYRFSLAFKEINVSSFTGYSFANYLLEQIQTIPTTLLPILVLNILGPSFGAYFSIPWSIGLGMVSLAGSVSETLFSEGAYDPTNAAANVRKSARFGFLVTLGMAACAITSGRLMLYIYGPQYAENGAWLLYLVSLALLPDVLIMIFVSYLRIQDRLNVVLIITSVNAALGIGLGVAGMLRFGLTGAGAGWLASRVLVVGLVYFLKGAPRITPVPRAG